MTAALAAVDLLVQRMQSVPAHLAGVLGGRRAIDPLRRGERMVLAGVGLSEGPARYLEALLWRRGHVARYAPFSALVAGEPAGLGETLVLFSQGLSPNARMVLRRADRFRRVVLFTSVRAEEAGGEAAELIDSVHARGGAVVTLPPVEESGLLLRVVGPAVAALGACIAASRLGIDLPEGALDEVPAAAAEAYARAAGMEAIGAPEEVLGFVTCGEIGDPYQGLRGKWMEGLLSQEPQGWDVLSVAHGPLQALHARRATLIALGPAGGGAARGMFDRLERTLDPARHRVLRLSARLPGLLGYFEHDAACNALVERSLRASGRDISDWPGRGRDAPLYGLDGREGSS